jgi:cystathionine beta-lyase/cystathionine gamma-synthase
MPADRQTQLAAALYGSCPPNEANTLGPVVRLAIGLESPTDLLQDLRQALDNTLKKQPKQ